MVTNKPLEIVLKRLPKWDDEWWPGFKRGHHIDEIIDCAYELGYALVPITRLMLGSPDDMHEPMYYMSPNECNRRFGVWLGTYDGILIKEKHDHACAWSHLDGLVYDPAGSTYPLILNDFCQFWAAIPV